jgi:polysaccharide export outer membrane protein
MVPAANGGRQQGAHMLGITLLLLAASQAPAPPAGPPPAASQTPPPTPDTRAAGAASLDYRIGPGDILHVKVYGHEDLSHTVVVQPDGTFVFPLVGSVPAAEATPEELEARIVGRLSKGLIRDPQVSVVVQEYRSKVVYVVGEVTRPGTYPLGGETRIVEILSRAGPLSANAGSEVLVVRPSVRVDRPVLPTEATAPPGKVAGGAGQAGADVLHVDLREIQAGKLEKNIALKANDTVFVPPAARIFVTGEVRNPGSFPFSSGITARQAVSLAGGFTEDAVKGSAHVVRDVNGKPKSMKVKLDEPLRPGDTLEVKAKWF